MLPDVAHLHDLTTSEYAERLAAIRYEIRLRTRRAEASRRTYLKVCATCSTGKPADAFNLDATRPDGLDWRCRSCRQEIGAQRRRSRRRPAA